MLNENSAHSGALYHVSCSLLCVYILCGSRGLWLTTKTRTEHNGMYYHYILNWRCLGIKILDWLLPCFHFRVHIIVYLFENSRLLDYMTGVEGAPVHAVSMSCL